MHVNCSMEPISRILEAAQYEDVEFLHHKEIEVMLEIAASIAGTDLQEGDEKRITRHQVTGETNTSVIFWDGVRKGIMYSGPELDKEPDVPTPAVWLIFYVPEEDLI
jgi:hypothetical protein